MGGAIVLWLFVPILSTSKIRSTAFRPLYKLAYWFLVADFLLLGWIGQEVVYPPVILIGQLGTLFYFVYFLIFIPIIGIIETMLMKHKVVSN
jgi:ubiquinol-cytochrome c reductase cytochrome b subunit